MNIKISNDKCKARILNFLSKIEGYSNFDKDQTVRIFLNSDNDFIGFESVKYNLNFISTNHKLIEINNSNVIECDYLQFSRVIRSL